MKKRTGLTPIIVDTGFFAALLDKKDRHHKKAQLLATQYDERKWITTWPVITELAHLLPMRTCLALFKAQQQEDFFSIYSLTEHHLPRISHLLDQYKKQRLDLADVSLVILAEDLNSGDILTCDHRDFSILRWGRNRAFNNLWQGL